MTTFEDVDALWGGWAEYAKEVMKPRGYRVKPLVAASNLPLPIVSTDAYVVRGTYDVACPYDIAPLRPELMPTPRCAKDLYAYDRYVNGRLGRDPPQGAAYARGWFDGWRY